MKVETETCESSKKQCAPTREETEWMGRTIKEVKEDAKKIISDIVSGSVSVREFYKAEPSTSCIPLPKLAKKLSVKHLYVKDESTRFGLNAFKGVGAYYAMKKAVDQNPDVTTFCTATDGNHGAAVAWASKKFNKSAVIFVPKNTPPSCIKKIEGLGATVIKTELFYDETVAAATKFVEGKGNGWMLLQDTAWKEYEEIPLWIMQGYQRLCQELEDFLFLKEAAKVDYVILQVGVGSFAGAVSAYLEDRYKEKAPKIVYVEPREADCLYASIEKGELSSTSGSQTTTMSGLNCGTPSTLAYPILRDCGHDFIRISDEEVRACIQVLYESDPQIKSGNSAAAVGLAALRILSKHYDLSQSSVLLWNTEGTETA